MYFSGANPPSSPALHRLLLVLKKKLKSTDVKYHLFLYLYNDTKDLLSLKDDKFFRILLDAFGTSSALSCTLMKKLFFYFISNSAPVHRHVLLLPPSARNFIL